MRCQPLLCDERGEVAFRGPRIPAGAESERSRENAFLGKQGSREQAPSRGLVPDESLRCFLFAVRKMISRSLGGGLPRAFPPPVWSCSARAQLRPPSGRVFSLCKRRAPSASASACWLWRRKPPIFSSSSSVSLSSSLAFPTSQLFREPVARCSYAFHATLRFSFISRPECPMHIISCIDPLLED